MTAEVNQQGQDGLNVFIGPFIFLKRESDNVVKRVMESEGKVLGDLTRGPQRAKQLRAKQYPGSIRINLRPMGMAHFKKLRAQDWRTKMALRQESAVLFNASSGRPFPLLVLDETEVKFASSGGQQDQLVPLWSEIDRSVDIGSWVTSGGTLNFPKDAIRSDTRANHVCTGTDAFVPLSVWFMVVAVKCLIVGVDVLFIVVHQDTLMRSLHGFQHVKAMFPALRSVVVTAAHADTTKMEWARQLLDVEQTGITVQVKMPEAEKKKRDDEMKQQVAQARGGAVSYGWAEAMHGGPITLEQFRPVDMSDDAFVANTFLKTFLKELGSKEPANVVKLYAPNALFSMTVQIAGKEKPIAFYERFDHNLFKNRDETLFEGREAIGEAYAGIFEEGFECVATSMNATSIEPDRLHFVVLHGVFQPQEQLLFGFDRTLVIEQDEDTFMIVNDQLHIRTA